MPRMFKVRETHMAAFSKQQGDRFEDEMVVYLKQYYPTVAERLKEDGLRDFIRLGVDKAKGYHFVRECDVGRYIQLMAEIGPDFDENDRTAWTQPILQNHRILPPDKMDRIAARWAAQQAQEPDHGS